MEGVSRSYAVRDYSTSLNIPQPKAVKAKNGQERKRSFSHSESTRTADFFSNEVFQIVLRNPTTVHQLRKFSEQRLYGDKLDFLEMVDTYQSSINQFTKVVFDIHKSYISVKSPQEIGLPDDVLLQINKNLKALLGQNVPFMENIFGSAQNVIENDIERDVYPAFVRHQLTISATKALAKNKNKYAGLGDCFVLTSPAKADNPIVFVSDGFAKVTGYSREDIIPRNCRFLQTRHTDKEVVGRIKSAITDRRESVELLLNERKNGEPFWNLLYITPLIDQSGRVAFFLGGQIDMSTAIHNTSDVLRTLSATDDDVEEEVPAKKSRWRPFRKSISTTKVPGMENQLLNDMSNLNFKAHKHAFYTAYSRFFVVDMAMKIAFHSTAMVDMLGTQLVGVDVFKALAQHTPASVPSGFTSQVKSAIKAGRAISIDLFLTTQRLGSEKFTTHWTPLKNENGDVGYVVLTLGSINDA